MFEDRKLKALQTMTKKEKKVEEIEALLQDVIAPKLDGLRKEKTDFIEYKRAESEIEKLAKFLAAYDYYSCSEARAKSEAELEKVKADLQNLDEDSRANKLELESIDDKIMVIGKRKEKESKAAYKLKELEAGLKGSEHELVKLQARIDISKSTIEEENKELDSLRKKIQEAEKSFEKDSVAFTKMKEETGAKDSALAALKEKVERDEELLRSLSTGISSTGQATGYDKLVEEAQNRINAAQIKVQQSELRMRSLEESMSEMKEDVSKARKESTGATKKIDALKAEISGMEMEKGTVEFDLGQERALEEERRRLDTELSSLKERLDQLKSLVTSIGFSYTDPYPNFDRSLVKGVIAELVSLSPSNMKYANALEIAAGGRLYNVVVEDEKVANGLLEKGRLQRRVTIIPLTKIQAKPITNEKARLASELTSGRAVVGLTLVTCPDGVMEAIKFVFGNSFICEDKESASKIAFDSRIGHKAVTLDGDVYEPSGTLSGGSSSSSGSVLARLADYSRCKTQFDSLLEQLNAKKAELEAVRAARRKCADFEQRFEQKSHELKLLERQLAQNSSGRLVLQYETMVSDLATLNQIISEALAEKANAERDLVKTRSEMSEFSSNRDGKLKSLEKDVSAGKKQLAKEAKAVDLLSTKFVKIESDLKLLESNIKDDKIKAETSEADIIRLENELASLQSEFFEHQSKTIGLRVKYETEVQHLRQFDEELRMLELQKQQLADSIEQAQLDKKKIQSAISGLIDGLAKYERMTHALLQQHPWIRDQQKTFGVAGSPFDFGSGPSHMAECRKRLASHQEQHSRLRKNINFNVMDMIDRIEAKETALKQMFSVVKKDRKTIEETIDKLNNYKMEALDKTYRKVNEDFGLIFSELLPNSFAKLEPIEGQPITEGLEIKVQLGGVWKNSLTELSGGQRSVIALSLILSLLQFKPAPMYILDEVDAALDLSHTENIGRLFQNRFKGSQFIVVSLKEGMFSNANVLFKTRFRDGISSVERTENANKRSASSAGQKKSQKRTGIALPKANKVSVA